MSDHWETPSALKDSLINELDLTFDSAPLKATHDGLKILWIGAVFCNPPYSKISAFLKKGLYHLANGDCEKLVYLLPSRTDTAWFHDYCLKATEIRFLRGRLKFSGAKSSAPFPSMIVLFNEWKISDLPMELI